MGDCDCTVECSIIRKLLYKFCAFNIQQTTKSPARVGQNDNVHKQKLERIVEKVLKFVLRQNRFTNNLVMFCLLSILLLTSISIFHRQNIQFSKR